VSKVSDERSGFSDGSDGFTHGFSDCFNCSPRVNRQRFRGRLRRRHW
jgi:hypothetical protein